MSSNAQSLNSMVAGIDPGGVIGTKSRAVSLAKKPTAGGIGEG